LREALAKETDEAKRQLLARLLAEEEKKLAAANQKHGMEQKGKRLGLPISPVRRPHINLLFSFGVNPPSKYPATWKNKSVQTVVVDYGNL
jgi:hypothetical protein